MNDTPTILRPNRRTLLAAGLAMPAILTLTRGAFAQAQINLTLGHNAAAGNPRWVAADKFGELVKERTNGRMSVRVAGAEQLGNEQSLLTSLRTGAVDMTVNSQGSTSALLPELAALGLPFLFANSAAAFKVLEGPIGTELDQRFGKIGMVPLGWWDNGIRNVTNSKRPITKPEDLEGLKLRVIPNPVFLETFKAFKANPLPMPFAELYGALESRAVDGQENPFAVILSNKMYEVQKYVSATNHVYAANIVLVSKRFWDKLSAAEKKAMNDAANEARSYQRTTSRAAAQKAVAELQAKGMQYNELTPAAQNAMSAIAKPVTDRLAASYDPAIVKLYNEELVRIRK